MTLALVVARKEIRDHLRDVRSLVSAAMMSLIGPFVVGIVSMSDRVRSQSDGVMLGMLSVFALVSSFVGAIDIAMDATAGERERRSLLPLLLNPIPASEVIVGKWIAVTIFALVTLGLNALGLLALPRVDGARATCRAGLAPGVRNLPDDQGSAHGAPLSHLRADADRHVPRVLSTRLRSAVVHAGDRTAGAHRLGDLGRLGRPRRRAGARDACVWHSRALWRRRRDEPVRDALRVSA